MTVRLRQLYWKSTIMRKYLSLVFAAVGIGCSTTLVYVNFSAANAQNATEVCNAGCVQKRVDALDQKINSLEQTMDALAIEMNKSIKTGKKVTLHTDSSQPGGCLTYIGPSGDLGGYVSWSVNCSRGTSWIIDQTTAQASKTDRY
jgi:hypothetical protein